MSTHNRRTTVLLLGARGYVGSVLLERILQHPYIDTVYASSDSAEGRYIASDFPLITEQQMQKLASKTYISTHALYTQELAHACTAIFSALPHGVLAKHIQAFLPNTKPSNTLASHSKESTCIIDLSGDFRLKNSEVYAEYYRTEHPNPSLLAKATYGLSEWYRHDIQHATIIANPGCYPTATLLPMLPILRTSTIQGLIHITAITGISGAGRTQDSNFLFCERNENISAYKSGIQHRHVPEIQQEIKNLGGASDVEVVFTPHLAPISSGMYCSIMLALPSRAESIRAREALYAQYLAEPFVSVIDSDSNSQYHGTLHVRNSNHAIINTRCEDNCILLHCMIDNLWKGAAGQALQNFNIRFGYEEWAGLT
ncbi:N-acetyl-gamma-glutamyl-phosphate reductase-like [Ylistrum balloti]|uniref:N-acetyl-gamma-glutamyl-phosphate reductase-like n=1 Tax=Ylistrum balloti TaxID=509963 RepID=UPI002905EB08|nr:N-acetyl-gamma-glutamyl-phosphate reductase-like [Ylistrum balloti]